MQFSSIRGAARALVLAAACSVLLMALGCSKADGGQPRGLFMGYVTDKTEEEVTAKVGKPDSVDNSKPETPRWVYKRKTFDPENMNQVDNETILIFQKDATGKFRCTQVTFS